VDKGYIKQTTTNLYEATRLLPDKEPLKFFIREKGCQILADSFLFFSKRSLTPQTKKKNELSESKQAVLDNIEILISYFGLAKAQKWVDKKEMIALEGRYNNIKDFIKGAEIKKTPEKDPIFSIKVRPIGQSEQNGQFNQNKREEQGNYSEMAEKTSQIDQIEQENETKEWPQKENYSEVPSPAPKNNRTERILEIIRSKQKARIAELKRIFPQVSKRTLRRDFEILLSRGLVERIGEGKGTFYTIKSV